MHHQLAVLRVDTNVLDVPGTVIADGNASSDWTGFWPSPQGLLRVNRDDTFAEDWRDPDQIVYWQKKSAKCAELLVPRTVDAQFIRGIYVSCAGSHAAVRALQLPWPISIDAHLFFQG
jgi:hypothetical protein